MKKRVFGLILVFVLLISAIPASAQGYNLQDLGISFEFPNNNWQQVQVEGAQFSFAHKDNINETISLTVGDAAGINDVSQIPQENLENLCADLLSDTSIAQRYTAALGAQVYIQEDEVSAKYAHWNTNNFYTYEKFYYAWADGYTKEKHYHGVFVALNAGKIYVIEYRHFNQNIHTSDFSAFLKSIQYTDTTIKIYINGKQIFPDSNPLLVNDRTLVPIRAVAEAMGYTVNWYEEQQMVELISREADNVLIFGIDRPNYARGHLNDSASDFTYDKLDVPAQIIGSRTYLPLRAVAEGMDAVVRWEGDTNSVHITY